MTSPLISNRSPTKLNVSANSLLVIGGIITGAVVCNSVYPPSIILSQRGRRGRPRRPRRIPKATIPNSRILSLSLLSSLRALRYAQCILHEAISRSWWRLLRRLRLLAMTFLSHKLVYYEQHLYI